MSYFPPGVSGGHYNQGPAFVRCPKGHELFVLVYSKLGATHIEPEFGFIMSGGCQYCGAEYLDEVFNEPTTADGQDALRIWEEAEAQSLKKRNETT